MTEHPPASEVPIWPHFVPHVLTGLADGTPVHRRELFERVAASLPLSDEARAETLNSGQGRAENRFGWSLSHLSKAGWVDRPRRATYQITDRGRDWLQQNQGVELTFASAHQLFNAYWPTAESSTEASTSMTTSDTDVAPLEQVEDGIARLTDEVAEELLTRLRESDPAFFEAAVIKVLLAMGYGGAAQRGRAIGGTGDGGVDGVIDQDALGLERIYVQAKRYAEGNAIGREAIQAFFGALHGFSANRGVFITTSRFTPHALQYAEQTSPRIVLIDGARLVNLMITYRVGVQVAQTYHVVELDEDFFE